MIRVGVEGYAVSGRRTGIGRFTAELLGAAARAGRDRAAFSCVLFRNNPDGPPATADLAAAGIRVLHPGRRRFDVFRYGSRLGLPIPADLLLGGQDVWLFPNFRRYPSLRAPTVTFVHDLSHLAVPDAVAPGYLAHLRRHVETAVRHSDRIGAISQTVAAEIAATYPGAGERVFVAPPGSATTLPRDPPADWRGRLAALGLADGFVLHVGTLEPRKNLRVLVAAMARLPPAVARAHPLVLVGARSWGDEALVAELAAAGDRVRHLPFVGDADLRVLYAGAALLAFPSRYEGFGMPLLEAMALGVPVACSDIPVFREVAGGAAAHFDHTDPAAIAAVLGALLDQPAERAALRRRGLARAPAYSWDASAATLLDALSAVAGHTGEAPAARAGDPGRGTAGAG